ncbi:hypothetical protein P73_1086 [Celeribacter indicus]|uniref:Permease n=1 Tax=Celeribacter indicus TaxID=1208324 RepID=A0A0B5DYK0_9RHOB|nr:hypothetical protein P73_1086 [Celeribacter indicus]
MRNTAADPPPEPRRRRIVDGGFLVLLSLTLVSGGLVLLTRGPLRVWEITQETFGFLLLLSPKIVAGVFIAATLPLVLPGKEIGRWIGAESGLRGLVLATVAGAAIPGGPMMTFPLAAGFGMAGADIGTMLAFVTGWSLLSLNRTLIWEFSFLPHDLVWTRYLLSLPFPVLVGLGARALRGRVPA